MLSPRAVSGLQILLFAVSLSGTLPTQVYVDNCPFTPQHGVGLCARPGGGFFYTVWGSQDGWLGWTSSGCSGFTQSSIFANTQHAIGVAAANGLLYVADYAVDDVDIYTTAGTYVSSWPLSNSIPLGITYSSATDRLYVVDCCPLWHCDEYTLSGQLTNSFPLSGYQVRGITWDPVDDSFWAYDAGTDRLRHYDAGFQELSAVPGTIAQSLGSGHGVAVRGDDLFVMCNTNVIARFSKTSVVAESVQYGSGCPHPYAFYEQFFAPGSNDLSGRSVELVSNANGFDVRPCATSCVDPAFGAQLAMGDDQVLTRTSLFPWPIVGVGGAPIEIDSNGRVGWSLGGSQFEESAEELLGGRMIAGCWDDLDPSAGGAVHYDADAQRVLITWDQVPQWTQNDANTFQIRIESSGRIVLSWQQVADDAIVGLNLRPTIHAPGSMDLSALAPFVIGTSSVTLGQGTPPRIGTTFRLDTSRIPSSATFGITAFGGPEVVLPLPGAQFGCRSLCSVWGTLSMNLITGRSSLPLPNDNQLLGLPLCAQSAVLDPTVNASLPVLTSNGLRFVIGNL